MASSLVHRFKEKYESLAGHVHFVDDLSGAAEVVMMVLNEAVGDRLALGELPVPLTGSIEERCRE